LDWYAVLLKSLYRWQLLDRDRYDNMRVVVKRTE
jgi:hypothetical protein